MKFFRKNQNTNEYVDTIFSVVNAARKDNDPDKINGTAGCLAGEDGKLFVYNSVFNSEKNVEAIKKASYKGKFSKEPSFLKGCKEVLTAI